MANTRKSPQSNALLAHVSAVVSRHAGRGDRLVAGLSGGVDSVVLIDLLRRLAGKLRFKLDALHVNHQINPAAGRWAAFCRAWCKREGIPFKVVKVDVPRTASLEAAARIARYQALGAAGADFIALAHNLDDQAETVLLQLLRGAGVKGASAMPVLRGEARGVRRKEKHRLTPHASPLTPSILRPLLDIPRSEIVAYALNRGLQWIEDDSNADVGFDRNFMRHQVLPVIARRYPAYRRTLMRASGNFAEAAELLDELAQADAQLGANGLRIAALRGLSAARAKNVVRYFLATHGLTMPNATQLAECVRQLRQPRAVRVVVDLGEHALRRYAGELRVVAKVSSPAAGLCRVWQGENRMPVPELYATLVMKKRRGAGISLAKLQAAVVTVRVRQGGESLRPHARRPRRSLKNLLQEARLPPWLRERLPLLFCGNTLVYVPGIGIDTAFGARRDEAGIEPCWEPDAPPGRG